MADPFAYYASLSNVDKEEKRRREMNARLYNSLADDTIERTNEDIESFNSFMKDMNTFSLVYDDDVPRNFIKSMVDREYEKENQMLFDKGDEFEEELFKDYKLSNDQKKLRDQFGVSTSLWINPEGKLVPFEGNYWDAYDYLSYNRSNMLALSGVEQASIFNVTNKYTAMQDSIYGPLEEAAPELFPEITEEEQENIDRAMAYEGSWMRSASNIPGLDLSSGRGEEVDTRIMLGENVRSWFNSNILPTDFLGGQEQEGWDGAKAWELMQEYHPGFSAHLLTNVGIDPKALARSPNRWEFRYLIADAIQSSALQQQIMLQQQSQGMFKRGLVFTGNFFRQSFRSADMPVELALTAVTWGGYTAVSLGRHGYRGYRSYRRLNTALDTAQLFNRAGDLTRSTVNSQRITSVLQKAQAYFVPSNWGMIASNFVTGRRGANLVDGVAFGTRGAWYSRFGQMAVVDAAQGTVEGFLYGLQNQFTMGGAEVSWGQIFTETWQEAAGQMVFGKIFRAANIGVGQAVSYADGPMAMRRTWNAVSKVLSPGIKENIELNLSLRKNNYTPEQIEMAHLTALTMAQQHVGWQMLTGSSELMPLSLSQQLNVLRNAAIESGVSIDPVAIMEAAAVAADGQTLTPEMASVLVMDRALSVLNNQGVRVEGGQLENFQRGMAVSLIVESELRNKGIKPNNPKYKEEAEKIMNELGANPDRVNEFIAEIKQEVETVLPTLVGISPDIVTGTETIINLESSLTDESGTIDTGLLNEILDGGVSLAGLNIADADIAALTRLADAEAAPKVDSGDTTPLAGEPRPEPEAVPEDATESDTPADPAPETTSEPVASTDATTTPVAETTSETEVTVEPEPPATDSGPIDLNETYSDELSSDLDAFIEESRKEAEEGTLTDEDGKPIDPDCL